MTTDSEEGRRQIDAMQPKPLKRGDKVRLKAGGERVMTVVALEDYGNMALCRWDETAPVVESGLFPVSSLVLVEDSPGAA